MTVLAAAVSPYLLMFIIIFGVALNVNLEQVDHQVVYLYLVIIIRYAFVGWAQSDDPPEWFLPLINSPEVKLALYLTVMIVLAVKLWRATVARFHKNRAEDAVEHAIVVEKLAEVAKTIEETRISTEKTLAERLSNGHRTPDGNSMGNVTVANLNVNSMSVDNLSVEHSETVVEVKEGGER